MTSPGKTLWKTMKTEENLTRKFPVNLRFATVNIGAMVGRGAKVTKTIRRKHVNVVALKEVQYKNEKPKRVRGDFEYQLYWREETRHVGVGLNKS